MNWPQVSVLLLLRFMNGSLPCILLPCLSAVTYYLDAFSWSLADYRRPVPYLFCLPFPNRASDSGDLYIDFDQNQLIFPAALLVFQVEAWFNLFLPELAYALHITSRISYHVLHHVACALLHV